MNFVDWNEMVGDETSFAFAHLLPLEHCEFERHDYDNTERNNVIISIAFLRIYHRLILAECTLPKERAVMDKPLPVNI